MRTPRPWKQSTVSLGGANPDVDLDKALQLSSAIEDEERLGRMSVSYAGYRPASEHATAAARGSSRKSSTSCELALRRALWRAGYRYRINLAGIAGHPDIVFPRARLVVFCDGDFWHGRDWERRRQKLERGANARYWVSKIEQNRQRDQEITARLQQAGWTVLRFWETDIRDHLERIVQDVAEAVDAHRRP